ncbi:MAG: hypothetical protein U1E45_12705 [Geminicoccaceae bacterium]
MSITWAGTNALRLAHAGTIPAPGEIERVQQYGNSLRGLAYVPLSRDSAVPEPATFAMVPTVQLP